MHSKISIFLLTCIICAGSTPPKKDVFEREYNIAKRKLDVPVERGFNEVEMAKYAGINVPELREIANSISISIENLENINSETFKLLVKVIKKKSFNAMALMLPVTPKTDVGAGPSNMPTLDEDDPLKKEYSVAKRRLDVPDGRDFNEVEMAKYAGINVPELREIANSISIHDLGDIDFETFKLLLNAISIKRDVSVKEPRGELEAGPSNRSTSDEDEILEAAYYACRLFLKVPNDRGIKESEMATFMEIDVLELKEIANTIELGNIDRIDLKTFKLLANAISKKRNVSIREPQGDPAFPSDRPIINEDEVLEMAFNILKIDLGLSTRRGLNASQMANYAGISEEDLKEIANSIPIKNLNKIKMRNFKKLAKKISEIKGVPIVDLEGLLEAGLSDKPPTS